MKKYLILLLVGLLVLATLTACGDDPSESAWYEDWLGSKSEETTTEPEETTTEPEEATIEPEETTTEPEETTTEPEETTTEPEETTTEPEETTTEEDWDWGGDWGDYDPPTVTTTRPAETTTEPEDTTTEPEDTTDDTTVEPEKYTITYELHGGSFSSEDVVYEFTSEEAVTLPIPTKTDLVFAGWYENKNFAGNAVTEIPVGTVGDKTFYAKWKVEGITYPSIPLPPFDDVQ